MIILCVESHYFCRRLNDICIDSEASVGLAMAGRAGYHTVGKIKKIKDNKAKPVISVINLHVSTTTTKEYFKDVVIKIAIHLIQGPILHQQKPWSKKFISMENSRKNIDKAFDAKKLEAVFLR